MKLNEAPKRKVRVKKSTLDAIEKEKNMSDEERAEKQARTANYWKQRNSEDAERDRETLRNRESLERQKEIDWEFLSDEEQKDMVVGYINRLYNNLKNPRQSMGVSIYTDVIPNSVDITQYDEYQKLKELKDSLMNQKQSTGNGNKYVSTGGTGGFTRGDWGMFRND